ncbi:hypothetical protein [Streptomyces sp. NPDC002215]|uniref:hypothetical protein n=1 Tax=Streptomyces sp. NPDC002215 TaxID=3154412 RepID=UPI003323CD9A
MDLFGQRRAERKGLDDSPQKMRDQLADLPHAQVVSDRGDRVRYKDLLAGARFGIAPFRPGRPWSMRVIDCQGMGLPAPGPSRTCRRPLLLQTAPQTDHAGHGLKGKK